MIILGIFGVIFGCLLTIKTNWFLSFFGPLEWFEKHFHPEGGSRFGYKIIGIGLIIFSFMLMTGLVEDIIVKIFVHS